MLMNVQLVCVTRYHHVQTFLAASHALAILDTVEMASVALVKMLQKFFKIKVSFPEASSGKFLADS